MSISSETDINDLVDRCENRLSFLVNKLAECSKTKQAVKLESESTKKCLKAQQEQILASLAQVLEGKFKEICSTVYATVEKDIQHLNEIDEALNNDVDKLKQLINEVKTLTEEDDKDRVCDVGRTLSEIGKGSAELPIVSLSFSSKIDESALSSTEELVADLLKLSMTGSVQIVECVERPGAIIVRWDEQEASESESVTTDTSSISEFVLQFYEDGGTEDGVFRVCYEGDEMQFTFVGAEPYRTYSFRVCTHTTTGVYGPWSMTRKACTTLEPHVWREEDCVTENNITLYQLSNKARTTTKIFPESSRILRSKVASYILGQHVQFKIEEAGESSINDGIGFLSHNKQAYKNLTQSPNTAILNTRGTIFVNGSPMVTKLPALKRGSVMLCHASRQSSGKLRVTISMEDKEVTFDWNTQSEHYDALYFACGFENTGWQVSVV